MLAISVSCTCICVYVMHTMNYLWLFLVTEMNVITLSTSIHDCSSRPVSQGSIIIIPSASVLVQVIRTG